MVVEKLLLAQDFESNLVERELNGAQFAPANEHRLNLPLGQIRPKACAKRSFGVPKGI